MAWVFDEGSAKSYPAGVEVSVVPARMLAARCGARAMIAGGHSGPSMVVEVEINSVGQYFRGEADSTFFLPLDSYLAQSPVGRVLPAARMGAWRYRGVQLLLPRDVNPVGLMYRADLFSAAGVDVGRCANWGAFIAGCQRYEAFWAAHGQPQRRAFELPRGNASAVLVILQQRGVRLIDLMGAPRLTDERVVSTLMAYGRWLASGVGANPERTIVDTAEALQDGRLGALLTPDWRAGQLRRAAPELFKGGEVRLRGLPVFSASDVPADAPTASWGGTGVGIPRDTPSPLMSWKMIEALYLDRESNERRWEETGVLPAVTTLWVQGLGVRGQGLAVGGAGGEWGAGGILGDPFVPLAMRLPMTGASSVITPRLQMELNGIVGELRRRLGRESSVGREDQVGAAGGAEAWLRGALREAEGRLGRELAQ